MSGEIVAAIVTTVGAVLGAFIAASRKSAELEKRVARLEDTAKRRELMDAVDSKIIKLLKDQVEQA